VADQEVITSPSKHHRLVALVVAVTEPLYLEPQVLLIKGLEVEIPQPQCGRLVVAVVLVRLLLMLLVPVLVLLVEQASRQVSLVHP
jgi:hypothetical protein